MKPSFLCASMTKEFMGSFDYSVVTEMRAANQLVTLDQQSSSLVTSVLWDSTVADQLLQLQYTLPVETVDTTLSPSTPVDMSNELQPLPSHMETDEGDGADAVVPPMTGATSTAIIRPNKRRSTTGGRVAYKKQRGKTAAVTTTVEDEFDDTDLDKFANVKLAEIADADLAEYLVATSTLLNLPSDFWPKDQGAWVAECIDCVVSGKTVKMVCSLVEGPVDKDMGAVVEIQMSPSARGKDYSIRRCLLENYPQARTPRQVYESQAHFARVFGAWTRSAPNQGAVPDTKWKPSTVNKPSLAVATLFALQAVTWAAISGVCKDWSHQSLQHQNHNVMHVVALIGNDG